MSNFTQFLPASGIDEIRKPVITSPANNATGVSLTPTINGSAFAPAYSVDTRDYRQLQIDLAAGDFTSPVVDQQENANNITVSTPLAQTTAFKARIRDVATTGVASQYSTLVSFTTLTQTVPDAPTIGTATQTGPTTATVTFTAPANDGSSPITSYTATSSPAGGTGTLNQAGSGTINVTGLTTGTAYTFTVTATNAIGTSAASAASNSITPVVPAIGSAFEGGFYAGEISYNANGVATHYLVVAPVSGGQSSLAWKSSNTSTAGTSSLFDGLANSNAMNNVTHPAAEFCRQRTLGGFTDWYLPAINEIEICYFNLKPTTTSNDTTFGINANAVPARASNYTTGNPPQTSAASFQSGGTQAFAVPTIYWSSTEFSATIARKIEFSTGYADTFFTKTNIYNVRAVRKVPI